MTSFAVLGGKRARGLGTPNKFSASAFTVKNLPVWQACFRDLGRLVKGNARADPGLVLIEVDSHHPSLAHPGKVIGQDRIAILGPKKHHLNLCLRAMAVDGRDEVGIGHLVLQSPGVRLWQRGHFLRALLQMVNLNKAHAGGVERPADDRRVGAGRECGENG